MRIFVGIRAIAPLQYNCSISIRFDDAKIRNTEVILSEEEGYDLLRRLQETFDKIMEYRAATTKAVESEKNEL
jgi:hypothetical protein